MNIYIKLILIAIVFIIGFLSGKKIDSLYYEKILAVTYLSHSNTLKMIEDANQLIINERQSQINHLQEEFAIADKNHIEELQREKDKNRDRDNAIRNGTSVQPVKIKPTVCPTTEHREDSDLRGPAETTFAELDSEVTIRAYWVTDYGDTAIRNCNQLIDKVKSCIESGLCPFKII